MPRLHHGDCLEVLPTLEAQSVDAIICDQPYGTTACKWDSVIPFEPMWRELKRLIKPRGAIVLFGSQPFTSALVMSNPGWFKYEWVWEKGRATGFQDANVRPLKAHENIIVFSDSGCSNGARVRMRYVPIMELGEPYRRASRTRTMQYAGKRNIGTIANQGETVNEGTRYPRSIVRVSNPNQETTHPTQKPVALMEYLIRTYTDAGDVVLDFTMGSGTTGVACVNTGRAFVGIERDAGYYAIAERRIAEAQMQTRMAV